MGGTGYAGQLDEFSKISMPLSGGFKGREEPSEMESCREEDEDVE
jgi:hypothetical protein